jgi:hypothetical protein
MNEEALAHWGLLRQKQTIKVRAVFGHAMKPYKKSKSITPLILEFGT